MISGQARYMAAFPQNISSKAERELGFRCLALRQMIEDARDWFQKEGYL